MGDESSRIPGCPPARRVFLISMGFLVLIDQLHTFGLLVSKKESFVWQEANIERNFTKSFLLKGHEKKQPLPSANFSNSSEEPLRPHPHAGARYPNGTWGYVADVYRVKRYMLERYRNETDGKTTSLLSFMPIDEDELSATCNRALGNGTERRGWKILSEKVQVDAPNPEPFNSTKTPRKTASKGRILCAVYTHEGAHRRLPGIVETWAWRCNGFLQRQHKQSKTLVMMALGPLTCLTRCVRWWTYMDSADRL